MAGQRRAAKAAAKKAEYDAAVARNNQKMAEYQAADTREVGRIEEARHRMRILQTAGTAKAVLASSGFDITEGDAPIFVGEVFETGEVEAQTIRRNAENRARAIEWQGENYGAQATLYDAQTEVSPFTGAGALLGTFGQVANRWHQYSGSRAGTPGGTPSLTSVYT